MRPRKLLACATVLFGVMVAGVFAQRIDVFVASREHPAIAYSTGEVDNRVSRLNRQIQDGGVRLAFDSETGYLKGILDALAVPVESQVTVFSQASLQSKLINPKNPRAVYFNDAVAVGWVRGSAELEVAVQDPRQGAIFYSLNQAASDTPQLVRSTSCLTCHLAWETLGVPGFMVLSTEPMPDDNYSYASGFTSDHRSPVSDRWASWYVTGKLGPVRHAGNRVRPEPAGRTFRRPPDLASLSTQFDTKGYPTNYSDVVALMTLEHQAHMMNLITRLGWEARVAGAGADASPRVADAVRQLVDYLLFVDEAPLPSAIQGSSGFAENFSALGPSDGKGRSLRQFDLTRRLFRYRCSYMIYSDAFDALPQPARDAVYAQMWRVLSGQERQKPYAALLLADRRAIVEILRETKKDLPPDFLQAITQ
jgi:hypothetical protein